jgi:L-fuconolactonase
VSNVANSREDEPALAPELPIIDCHQHVFARAANASGPPSKYLLPELAADMAASGHHIVATMLLENHCFHRADGPAELRSLGETEAINAIAATSATGAFGPCRVAAGIIAFVDLGLGDAAGPVLNAHLAVAGERLKGVRCWTAYDPYPILPSSADPSRHGLMASASFCKGVALLAERDLSLDLFCFHTQLADAADLAAACPDTSIILDHIGAPLGVGPFSDRDETWATWLAGMRRLAAMPNVSVKIGGLGMAMMGLPSAGITPRAGSTVLAEEWRPYVETVIALFGPRRCMFESNYPPDSGTARYGTIWNAFKRLTASCSADERAALFGGTADRVYRLGIFAR